jgi:hypothetical protein
MSQCPQCPKCRNVLNRIRRTSLDRKLSYVVPVSRYICFNYACRWTGLRFNWSVHPLLSDHRENHELTEKSQPSEKILGKGDLQENDRSFSPRSSAKALRDHSLVSASQASSETSETSAKAER